MLFGLLALCLDRPGLYAAFGVEEMSVHAGLVFFTLLQAVDYSVDSWTVPAAAPGYPTDVSRITSYNVCYTKLLRSTFEIKSPHQGLSKTPDDTATSRKCATSTGPDQ